MPKIFILVLGVALALATADAAYADSANITYTYDLMGRVTTALYDDGVCITYSYDAVGNRSSQTNTTGGAPKTAIWGTGTWGCFAWSATGSSRVMAARTRKKASSRDMAPWVAGSKLSPPVASQSSAHPAATLQGSGQ